MQYCTNCGGKTIEKKVCTECGVALDSTNNFCKWCGTKTEGNKKCPNCGENAKRESLIGVIAKYVIGILLVIAGLGTLNASIVPAVSLVLFGVLLLPKANNFIKKLTCKNGGLHKKISVVRIILLVVLLSVVFVTMPSNNTEKPSDNSSIDAGKGKNEVVIHNGSDAVEAAKEYISANSKTVEQKLASECGLKQFYTPTYATYDEFSHVSSWSVTVKGNIGGYVDDYATDFEQFKFTIKLSVSEYGDVRIVSVDKSK